jgi:hypothetical protein
MLFVDMLPQLRNKSAALIPFLLHFTLLLLMKTYHESFKDHQNDALVENRAAHQLQYV